MTNCSAHSDKELLKLLLLDDVSAFTELYNRYWKKIYTGVYAVLHNKEAARDIVQDIFTSLWERRCDLEIECLPAYLHQAARFQVFKAIRHKKMDAGFYERLAVASVAIIAETPQLFKELTEVLDKILGELPEDHRQAFKLSREEGLSYREIAAQMNISTKTVEKKISHALKRLRLGFNEAFLLVVAALLTFHWLK